MCWSGPGRPAVWALIGFSFVDSDSWWICLWSPLCFDCLLNRCDFFPLKMLSLPMVHLTINYVTSYLFMRIRNRIYFMRDWTKFLVCWLSTNAQTFSFIRVWDRLYYKHNEGLDWPLFWYLRILVGVSLTT